MFSRTKIAIIPFEECQTIYFAFHIVAVPRDGWRGQYFYSGLTKSALFSRYQMGVRYCFTWIIAVEMRTPRTLSIFFPKNKVADLSSKFNALGSAV